MTISIIVPNYNGGKTIEAALQSLIGQNYPALEIIVVDGGSSDASPDIIRRHESHIAWWVSEPDTGQSQAINKGFARATGEVVNWLCSDDVLEPGALAAVARAFKEHPEADVVAGACRFVYPDEPWRDCLITPTREKLGVMPCTNPFAQPSCFFRRSLLRRTPVLDEALHYAMDLELWNYFQAQGARWLLIPEVLSAMYFSETNKTNAGGVLITREIEQIYGRYVHERIPLTHWHRKLRYPLERIRRRNRSWWFAALIYFPWQILMILALSPFYGFRRVRWMNWVEF